MERDDVFGHFQTEAERRYDAVQVHAAVMVELFDLGGLDRRLFSSLSRAGSKEEVDSLVLGVRDSLRSSRRMRFG